MHCFLHHPLYPSLCAKEKLCLHLRLDQLAAKYNLVSVLACDGV